MKKMNRLLIILLILLIIFILMWCKGCFTKSQTNTTGTSSPFPSDSAYKWADWNVLFKVSSTDSDRKQIMENISKSIQAYIDSLDQGDKRADSVQVSYVYCPCDTLLYNLVANISVGAVGTIATKPPKVPPPGSQGEPVQYILQNNPFNDSTGQHNLANNIDTNAFNYTVVSSKILAVMDTGLDSTLFANGFKGLLWNDPAGATLRNFLRYQNHRDPDYYFDDDTTKHGSAVTSTALDVIRKTNFPASTLPSIMVLKVLDSSGTGSSFSVSCALSYARQKKASVINASLGYFGEGEKDSVLRHYVQLCSQANPDPIPIMAAAGNVPGPHLAGQYNKPVILNGSNQNLLTDGHLFFPGCYSLDFSNVFCVTGLENVDSPCFYQNYSPTYVSLGVVTNPSSPNCCISGVNFYGKPLAGYDGTSFAAPVFSGQVMAKLLSSDIAPIKAANSIGSTATGSTGSVTRKTTKKFIAYKSIP